VCYELRARLPSLQDAPIAEGRALGVREGRHVGLEERAAALGRVRHAVLEPRVPVLWESWTYGIHGVLSAAREDDA